MQGFHLFTFASIPVYANPWFGVLLLFGFRNGIPGGVSWVIAVTSGLIVHEFGHALVARAFSLRPVVMLHGFGGLTSHAQADRDRDDALIVAAGPAAGLMLGVLSLIGWIGLHGSESGNRLSSMFLYGLHPDLPFVDMLFFYLIFVNVGWSILNLLPVWPLDGGVLYRLGLLQVFRPLQAERTTHITALVILAGGLYWSQGSLWMVIVVALLMWRNFQALRGEVRSGAVRSKNPEAKRLLIQAQQAYQTGNFSEAARLGQLIRQETTVAGKVMEQTWAVLGAATARLGQHQEALHYLRRAPATRDVLEALVECFYSLKMDDELATVLSSQEFQRLVPQERKDQILAVVGEALGGDGSFGGAT